MNVSELIKLLKTVKQDAEVICPTFGSDYGNKVVGVRYKVFTMGWDESKGYLNKFSTVIELEGDESSAYSRYPEEE